MFIGKEDRYLAITTTIILSVPPSQLRSIQRDLVRETAQEGKVTSPQSACICMRLFSCCKKGGQNTEHARTSLVTCQLQKALSIASNQLPAPQSTGRQRLPANHNTREPMSLACCVAKTSGALPSILRSDQLRGEV